MARVSDSGGHSAAEPGSSKDFGWDTLQDPVSLISPAVLESLDNRVSIGCCLDHNG